MGLDRFANFISKSMNNEGIEEINLDYNMRKIVSNHIIFDLNLMSRLNQSIKVVFFSLASMLVRIAA